MRNITLNPIRQRQVDVLTRLVAGAIDVRTAAELLDRSPRQVRRLRTRFQQEGMEAVLHGNQGRAPTNRTDPAISEQICKLASPEGKYHDFNLCHLHDLLDEQEHIQIGRSTLDRLLRQNGLLGAAHPPSVHRRRRIRLSAEGMLVQMDGSPHAWLEERGPRLALHGAIDDATGKVLAGVFRPTEDQIGYLLLIRTVAELYGLPVAVYHDRHSILRSPKQSTLDEQLAGEQPMSQIQRVLAQLGITSIPAHSPQAKGRIERLFETFQDRLVKEMRLAGVEDSKQANTFLPGFITSYNARFAIAPKDPTPAWITLPADLDRNYYFAIRETRTVRADHCISWQGQTVQLLPDRCDPSLARQTVSVHVVPEGDLFVYDGTRQIPHRLVSDEATEPSDSLPINRSQQPAERVAQPRTARQRAWLFGHR
jgi:transposase